MALVWKWHFRIFLFFFFICVCVCVCVYVCFPVQQSIKVTHFVSRKWWQTVYIPFPPLFFFFLIIEKNLLRKNNIQSSKLYICLFCSEHGDIWGHSYQITEFLNFVSILVGDLYFILFYFFWGGGGSPKVQCSIAVRWIEDCKDKNIPVS